MPFLPVLFLRAYALLLLAAALLLGTGGCVEKETPAPAGAGSYRLDGAVRTGRVQVLPRNRPVTGSGGQLYDYVVIRLTTASPLTEVLELGFEKPHMRATAAYTFGGFITYAPAHGAPARFTLPPSGLPPVTLVVNPDGSYSGTFGGRIYVPNGTVPPPYTAITDGVFANVRP